MDKEQLIQDYIADRLSEEDKTAVEGLLKTDADFKSDFNTYNDISAAFKDSEAKGLKEYFQELEEKTPRQSGLFYKYKYLYLAIASAVVIAFFYNPFNAQSSVDLFDSNFEIYPNTYQPVVRSSNTDNNIAFIAYENGDFVTAENEFQLLLNVSDNPNIRFYFASSLLNQYKYDLALKEFDRLNTQSHDYSTESLWYTALIHIKKENYTKALRSLEQLNTMNSTFKSEERELLLQKLKEY